MKFLTKINDICIGDFMVISKICIGKRTAPKYKKGRLLGVVTDRNSQMYGDYTTKGILSEPKNGRPQEVTVKFFGFSWGMTPQQFQQLHVESITPWLCIANPHVAKVHWADTLQYNGDEYYFEVGLEFVPGTNLNNFLISNGGLSDKKAVHLTKCIAAGLVATHSQGLPHGDLKPANIILTEDERCAVLIDCLFGARFMEKQNIWRLAGTRNYLPPERYNGTLVNPSSDIFALGVSFSEMLNGKGISTRKRWEETDDIEEHIATNLLPPIPTPLKPIAQKMLEPCMEKRIESDALLHELTQLETQLLR